MSAGTRGTLLVLGLAMPAASCAREPSPLDAPPRRSRVRVTDRDYAGPPLRKGRLLIPDAFGKQHLVTVEVADDDASRTRGLMWRERLADGTGMIFLFDRDEEHAFWMENTLISLDMLFLDANWRVAGILEAVPPLNRAPRTVGVPSRYVLEVPAGWCARQGIKAGAVVVPEGI